MMTALDPAYADLPALLEQAAQARAGGDALIDSNDHRFVRDWYGSQERRRTLRESAMDAFSADFEQSPHRYVWADARLTAVQFYQRLGAVPEGPTCIDDVTGLTDQRVLFDLSNGSDKA